MVDYIEVMDILEEFVLVLGPGQVCLRFYGGLHFFSFFPTPFGFTSFYGSFSKEIFKIKNMKKKNVKKTDEEISDEIKQALFDEINNTINDEIIKSLKTGKKSDCLIPMKKSKQ